MPAQVFSFIAGLYYLVFGILGLLPALLWPPPARPEYQADTLITSDYGYLLDFLPTNFPHNVLYILVGVIGILAGLFYGSSKVYARTLFGLATILVLLGAMPLTDHLFGFMPLFQWNIPTHAIAAALAWYFGFIYPITAETERRALAHA